MDTSRKDYGMDTELQNTMTEVLILESGKKIIKRVRASTLGKTE